MAGKIDILDECIDTSSLPRIVLQDINTAADDPEGTKETDMDEIRQLSSKGLRIWYMRLQLKFQSILEQRERLYAEFENEMQEHNCVQQTRLHPKVQKIAKQLIKLKEDRIQSENEMQECNNLLQKLTDSQSDIFSQSNLLKHARNLSDKVEQDHEEESRSATTPCIDDSMNGATWQDIQESLTSSKSARQMLHLAHAAHQRGRKDESRQVRDSPNGSRPIERRLDHSSRRILSNPPIIISNRTPEPTERLGVVQMPVINWNTGRKRRLVGLPDTGADINALAESYAKQWGAFYEELPQNFPKVKPFGARKSKVRPIGRCWLLIVSEYMGAPCWIEFYVFKNKIMTQNMCILSVKTVVKTDLLNSVRQEM